MAGSCGLVCQRGWDVHEGLPEVLPAMCNDVDQGCYGLITDSKSRGMLDGTLRILSRIRPHYSQGELTLTGYGRDPYPLCFSIWAAAAASTAALTGEPSSAHRAPAAR